MFGRIFGLDGRESYRELPSPSKPRLLRVNESIHAERAASEPQDRVIELKSSSPLRRHAHTPLLRRGF
jgi:hypothetical protein